MLFNSYVKLSIYSFGGHLKMFFIFNSKFSLHPIAFTLFILEKDRIMEKTYSEVPNGCT